MTLTPETLAWLCCGSIEEAHNIVTSVRGRHSDEILEQVIRKIASQPSRRGDFNDLDEMLRPDVTMKKTVYGRRALEWGVKRACLHTGLQCLGSKTRVVYVLRDIFDLTVQTIAMVLGTSYAVVATCVTRARRQLAQHYSNRCVHLHPANRCSCRGRVGSALRAGLVHLPILGRLPAYAHDAKPANQVAELIRGLPVPFGNR